MVLNILLIVIALILIGIGGWLSVSVAPNLWAFLVIIFQNFIGTIRGKVETSELLSSCRSSLGLLFIFIVGLVLIISSILIVKSRFFK